MVLLLLNQLMQVGPFEVTIESDEPFYGPYRMSVYFGKWGIGHGMRSTYREKRLLYANQPVLFPSANTSRDDHFQFNAYHPLYRLRSHEDNDQWFMPEMFRETRKSQGKLTDFQGFMARFLPPKRITLRFQAVPIAEANRIKITRWINERNKTKEKAYDLVRNGFGSHMAGMKGYVIWMKKRDPQFDSSQYYEPLKEAYCDLYEPGEVRDSNLKGLRYQLQLEDLDVYK